MEENRYSFFIWMIVLLMTTGLAVEIKTIFN